MSFIPKVYSEQDAMDVVDRDTAFAAVKQTFLSMADNTARNFPVVRESIEEQQALFGFKSGFDATNQLLGVKAGGYWANNMEQGLSNHQSSVLVFKPETGELNAVVSGNYLTAMRTAAAAAVAIDTLSRADVSTLSIIGAGKQAEYQVRAALRVRKFKQILIANRTAANAQALAEKLEDTNIPLKVVEFEECVKQADVLITIVSSFRAVVKAQWLSAGLHICAMGTDTMGKMELEPACFSNALVFTDELVQSKTIGEAQHAVRDGLISEDDIASLGNVLNNTASGRRAAENITIYDGTGVGLQDLAVAQLVVKQSEN
jgi:ornithine cyclodeaminase/alanine dehydrogenase-like protein (mu-crystallin family)